MTVPTQRLGMCRGSHRREAAEGSGAVIVKAHLLTTYQLGRTNRNTSQAAAHVVLRIRTQNSSLTTSVLLSDPNLHSADAKRTAAGCSEETRYPNQAGKESEALTALLNSSFPPSS